MEAINKTERNTSLVNFVAVYVIILAIPLFLAFFAGTRKSSGGGSAKAVNEQALLAERMEKLQLFITDMQTLDKSRPNGTSSPENWKQWLNEAEAQNEKFKQSVNEFRTAKEFTESRNNMRQSACTYLDMVYYERGVHLDNLKALRGVSNGTAMIQQLQAEKQALQTEKQQIQNNLNTANAMLAQKPAGGGAGGGGGGGGGDPQALTDLKWQLRFEDADCTKTKADMLAAYNEAAKRKQLYSTAKLNFQQIAQQARNSFTIQKLASGKVREIDQVMSRM